jgi:hypothetical protein
MARGRPACRRVKATIALLIWGVTGWARPTTAAPQASVSATVAGGVTDLRTEGRTRPALALGLRADLLFLRASDHDVGIGPYLDATTTGFETLETGGGIESLFPLSEALPLVVSVGAFGRIGPTASWEPGLELTLFLGSHGYNYHSNYSLTAGFFVQGRYGLGDKDQGDILAGVAVDLELIALPFVLLVQAFR